MTHEQLRGLAGLLYEILVVDQIERESAAEVAEHRWLVKPSRENCL